jgi:hypothetical protein
MSDHGRGCEGRNYVCTCGYDDAIEARATAAEAENTRLREIVTELLRYVPDDMIGCHGEKCRMPWCHSCWGEDHAEAEGAKALQAKVRARAALEESRNVR